MANKRKDNWNETWTTAAYAIYGAVRYTDKKELSLVDVMGLTGHAFRMNIDPREIHIAGPTSFPGGYIFRRNLCNLGFISNMGEAQAPPTPDQLERTMALVHETIDKGIPAIAVDLFEPEFGLIYGYDDEKRLFHAKDMSQDGTISYEKFANPKIHVLFLITISESLPHSKYEMLRMALDMIVDHARGREWNHIFKDRFVMGLEGYEAWIKVMESRSADELGNAYNVGVVGDAREFAAQFLRELVRKWDGTNFVERKVREYASEAAAHYDVVAALFAELGELFPFPQGGTPKDPETADRAVALLRQAKEAETKGMAVLEQFLDFMKAYHSEKWVH
ncbi:hypothetical protein D7Z26_22275 [Cohnella endophytica]|uniref:Uncharacterized protein n=1 Tax=Cohnella endophytica TaxID=2419778 RepID=A0A494XAU0_9BACL|nr:hypothetical protein [Cohnella endophytica]RKP47937.1 hypothetical protein D7Z26_22275 [Cohnella endophytica]